MQRQSILHAINVAKTNRQVASLLLSYKKETILYAQQQRLGFVHETIKFTTDSDRKKVLNHLFLNGANISSLDKNRRTALHEAVEIYNLDAMDDLISLGADVNAQDALGRTPLHLAALRNGVRAAIRLIDAHAMIFARDDEGKQFLELANPSFVQHIHLLLDVKNTIKKLDNAMQYSEV